MTNVTKAIKVGEMGRAVRLALLLLTAVLLSGLALPMQAQDKRTDRAGSSANWWLQVAEPGGELLVSVPMPAGAGWCLAWNHSVEGFEVHDCYRNQAGRMVLERSHLPDFAAGLDHIPGRGRQVSDGQGGYWIEDINEPVPGNRYRLRVGSSAVNHRLVSHGEPRLGQLLEDAVHTGCKVLAPGVEAGVETKARAGTEIKTEKGAATMTSLSDLVANQGVTVRLVAYTSCYSEVP